MAACINCNRNLWCEGGLQASRDQATKGSPDQCQYLKWHAVASRWAAQSLENWRRVPLHHPPSLVWISPPQGLRLRSLLDSRGLGLLMGKQLFGKETAIPGELAGHLGIPTGRRSLICILLTQPGLSQGPPGNSSGQQIHLPLKWPRLQQRAGIFKKAS